MNNTKQFNTTVISSKDKERVIEVKEIQKIKKPRIYHWFFGPTPKDVKEMNILIFTSLISLTTIPGIIDSLNKDSIKISIRKNLIDIFNFDAINAHILSLRLSTYIGLTLFFSILVITIGLLILNPIKTTKTNTQPFSTLQIIASSILFIMLITLMITLFFSILFIIL